MDDPSTRTIDVGLQFGERAPDMVLPDADGRRVRWYSQVGGVPALLVLAGADDVAVLQELDRELTTRDDLTVHVVGPPALTDLDLALPVLIDPEGRAGHAYRTTGQSMALMLDGNLRVRRTMALTDGRSVALAARGLVDQVTAETRAPLEISMQAPVLMIPDVLTPAQCAELMRVWEEEGNEATGVEDSTTGSRGERLQTKQKRRRDHTVGDQARTNDLAQTVGRRVMPEVRRAFHYQANRFEGFKIACYTDHDRGFFSAHRDNLSPSTAHRRFALTLNLNDGYTGGQLRFPEFGPDLYKPPPGGALVFSGSHLHEVLDVTEGRRFVLLSFVYGDDAVRRAPTDHSGHDHG